MIPIKFKEQTHTLSKPQSLTDIECGPLPVHISGKHIISRWKMSLFERIKVVFFGKIWLWVWSEESQPPIALDCRRTAFEKHKKAKGGYQHFWDSIRKK